MATPKNTPGKSQHRSNEQPEPEDAIMERMNEALKKMMSTPHETQKEMIERRRRQSERVERKR